MGRPSGPAALPSCSTREPSHARCVGLLAHSRLKPTPARLTRREHPGRPAPSSTRDNGTKEDRETRCERLFPRETDAPGKLERSLGLSHRARSRRPRMGRQQVAGMTSLRGQRGKPQRRGGQDLCSPGARGGGPGGPWSCSPRRPQTRLRCTESAEGPGGLKRDYRPGEFADRTGEPTFQNKNVFSSLGQAAGALFPRGPGEAGGCSPAGGEPQSLRRPDPRSAICRGSARFKA